MNELQVISAINEKVILVQLADSRWNLAISFNETILNAIIEAKIVDVSRNWDGNIKSITENPCIKTISVIQRSQIIPYDSTKEQQEKKLEGLEKELMQRLEEIRIQRESISVSQTR